MGARACQVVFFILFAGFFSSPEVESNEGISGGKKRLKESGSVPLTRIETNRSQVENKQALRGIGATAPRFLIARFRTPAV